MVYDASKGTDSFHISLVNVFMEYFGLSKTRWVGVDGVEVGTGGYRIEEFISSDDVSPGGCSECLPVLR